MKTYLLAEAVKAQLINLAIEDKLPSDLTTLDIQSVFDIANSKLILSNEYKKVSALENLEQYVVVEDEAELIKVLNILETYEDSSEITGHIEGIQMLERFEYSFTVKDLLQTIY